MLLVVRVDLRELREFRYYNLGVIFHFSNRLVLGLADFAAEIGFFEKFSFDFREFPTHKIKLFFFKTHNQAFSVSNHHTSSILLKENIVLANHVTHSEVSTRFSIAYLAFCKYIDLSRLFIFLIELLTFVQPQWIKLLHVIQIESIGPVLQKWYFLDKVLVYKLYELYF